MRNANSTRHRRLVAFAFCLLPFAFHGCAKTPPVTPVPAAPGPSRAVAVSPIEQLREDILGATRLTGVQRAAWGIVVHSIDRDERLVELSPRTLFVPASVAKLVSVASAAEAVGWDYRFETTLRATGSVVDGVLNGNLVVVGTGDPTIGGRAGDDLTVWIDALKAMGLRRIDGHVIGDDDLVEEPRPALAWAWDDLGYNAGVLFGALNFAENRMAVTIAGGPAEGYETTLSVEPYAANRPLINKSVTGAERSALLVWPEQRPGEVPLTIAGSIPAGSAPVRLVVSAGNPTLWFASVLRDRLIRGGIEVTGDALDVDDVQPRLNRDTSRLLFSYKSRPLSTIVQPLLKESINLYGEAVLRLNAARGALPTNDAALDGLKQRLVAWGIAADAQQLIDGSGLSRRDAIAPEAVLAVLRRMWDPAGASPFMTALPIAGIDGSLSGRMKGTAAEGTVRAKTGTMSNVRSMAGYATTKDGEHLAFVMMANNFEGSGAQANEALDRMAVRLASFSRKPTP